MKKVIRDRVQRVDFETTIHGSFTHFKADLLGGNLVILPGTAGQATIRIQWQGNKTSTLPTVFIEGSTLKIATSGLGGFLSQKDAYIIEVTLPRETHVEISMLAGVVHLEDHCGNVNATLRFGEITGMLAGAQTQASLWAGSIELSFTEITHTSSVRASCLVGDIKLQFPHGTISPSKPTSSDIPNTAGAALHAHVLLGDVSVS